MAGTTTPGSAAEAAFAQDPDAHGRTYPRRPDAELPFDPAAMPADLPVMPDTNVYILRLQRRLPPPILAFLEARRVLHCGVVLAEIAVGAGLLDPTHPGTAASRGALLRLLDAISLLDCRAPSPAAWAEAGMLAGILARTQLGLAQPRRELTPMEAGYQRGMRRALLNDALLFLAAREQGAILLSANVADMELMQRLRPDARLLLFRSA